MEEVLPEEEAEAEQQEAELLGISWHALAGVVAPRTMRVMGKIGEQLVVVLIDTGSTHSFVDQDLARRIRLPAEKRSQVNVMTANGDSVPYIECCVAVSLSLQGIKFKANLHLLTLGGCDVVLGVNWLGTMGPILWDFINLIMKFKHYDQEVLLQELIPATVNIEVNEELPKKNEAKLKGVWLQLLGSETSNPQRFQHPATTELLEGYKVMFQEPSCLPPHKSSDHRIPLKEGSPPTCVRPYHYPYY